jgi:preprotein translocase subunit SecA
MNSLRDEAVLQRLMQIQLQVAAQASGAPGKAMARRLSSGALDEEVEQQQQQVTASPQVFDDLPIMAPAPPRSLPAKGAETRLFALENGTRRNDPCPCGSGLKFKKCCYEEPVETASS